MTRNDATSRARVRGSCIRTGTGTVTVAALATNGNTEQLVYHLDLARRNGNTEAELVEAITHLAFYAGWPRAMAAMAVAKKVFQSPDRVQE